MFKSDKVRAFSPLLSILLTLCISAHATEPAKTETAAARKAEWAQVVDADKNLYQVTPNFYRSAQLKASDLQTLRELGIDTVLSLRSFHDDSALFAGSGLKLVRIPINTWQIGDKHVIAALSEIRRAEQQGKVLLHCQHGANRTGMISAMYRLVYQGWQREAAIDELKNGGYGYHAVWGNIIKYLKRVDAAKIRTAVEANLAKSATH